MRRIAILGSTGSIGCSALSVVEAQIGKLEVVALAAGTNVTRFVEQVKCHRPTTIAMATSAALQEARHALHKVNVEVDQLGSGAEGLLAVATHSEADIVLCATAGTVALDATLAAIEAGKTIALANKEVLVMAGGIMMEAARRHGVTILPVDSEHNAIHQCLHGRVHGEVRRLILTASGGPFAAREKLALDAVTPQEALNHPTWRMGPKITVDSATLMNKGLEVIEARWLFDVSPTQIDVVVHPQSIIHSLVELCDGSLIAQLGVADMRLPIQYTFSYPDRWDVPLPGLDLADCGRLDFQRPDLDRFPCLALARRALNGPAYLPIILNAANELAVEAFLENRLRFTGIPTVIERALDLGEHRITTTVGNQVDLDAAATKNLTNPAAVRKVDEWARQFTTELIHKVESE